MELRERAVESALPQMGDLPEERKALDRIWGL